MTRFVFIPIVLSIVAADSPSRPVLTFDEALALAGAGRASSSDESLSSELAALGRTRLPTVRAEATTNTSRTLHPFSAEPLQSLSTSSVIAVDYPLWDGGATSARIEAAEARLRRLAAARHSEEGQFIQVLDAFSDLYLAQRQNELFQPLSDKISAQAGRSAGLLASGDITNLNSAERLEIALSFASRLLDVETRRADAATRLRLLTGLEAEPLVVVDLTESVSAMAAEPAAGDERVRTARLGVEASRARLREVRAANGFQAIVSGFSGLGAANSTFRSVTSEGSFGIYGLRLHLSYPLLRASSRIPVAEARADLQNHLATLDAALDAARVRLSAYRVREQTAAKRIDLLRESVAMAKQREESVRRLVSAGVRAETDLINVEVDRTRREVELLTAEIERWKAARLLARLGAVGEPDQW